MIKLIKYVLNTILFTPKKCSKIKQFTKSNMKVKQSVDLTKVNKDLVFIFEELNKHLIEINSPVSFKIICGLRTTNEQIEIYRKGRVFENKHWKVVNRGKIITCCDGIEKLSNHQLHKAIDIMAMYKNKGTFKQKYYYYLAGIFEMIASKHNIKARWGGWFKDIEDCGHFELK